MKRIITEHEFFDGLDGYFSLSARKALYNYYCNLEDAIGQDILFDPIAISLEWDEYDSINTAVDDYGCSEKELKEKTTVIETDNSVLIQRF